MVTRTKIFLRRHIESEICESHDFIFPDLDKEIRSKEKVSVLTSNVSTQPSNREIGTPRFEHFSTWNSLVSAITFLKARITNTAPKDVDGRLKAEKFILKSVQREMYKDEIICLRKGEHIAKKQ